MTQLQKKKVVVKFKNEKYISNKVSLTWKDLYGYKRLNVRRQVLQGSLRKTCKDKLLITQKIMSNFYEGNFRKNLNEFSKENLIRKELSFSFIRSCNESLISFKSYL